jgi:uncharacterized membrane protein
MNKKLLAVIILCIIAIFNAAYLTNMAYSELSGPSFCDISATMSCTSVFSNTASQIFGIPFPVIALIVYPVLLLVAVLWYYKKINTHRSWLRWLSLGGMLFNGYIIFQETFVIKAFCPLCLLCTGIIITIHILSYGNKQSFLDKVQEIIEA